MHPLEAELRRAADVPMRFSGIVDHARLDENLVMVHAELDAPAEPRFARLLRRLRVPDLTVPVVSATPSLRRSWIFAVLIAVFFALSASTNATGSPK